MWLGLVLFLAFGIYAPALQNEFAWDDKAAKAVDLRGRNPNVAELHPISYYYTNGYWPTKDAGSPNYRPLTVLSFGLGHAIFGERADIAHLLTILAHLLAVWLAYLVLRSLGADWVAAVLGTLVFAVHALHSEAVAGIVGRAESLAFATGAVALLATRNARYRGRPAQLVLLGGAALALFASCSFKESGVAWAGLIPASLWLCPRRDVASSRRGPGALHGHATAGRVGFDRIGAGMLVIAMLLPPGLFVWAMQSFLAGIPETTMGYFENPHLFTDTTTRLLSSLVVWGYGFVVTLLPFRLGVDHGPCQFPIVTSFGDPWSWLAILVLVTFAALITVAFRIRKSHPLLAMGVGCFFGFSVLVSNMLFPIYVVFAERTYYTPSFGLSLALCALVMWLRREAAESTSRLQLVHPVWTLGLGLWVGFSVCMVWERNGVWADDLSLVEREVVSHPRSLRMLIVAGAFQNKRKEYVGAQARFEQALRLDPLEPRVWRGLAKALLHRGKGAEAVKAIDHALTLPEHRFHRYLRQELLLLAARIHTVTGDLSRVCEVLEESVREQVSYLRSAADLVKTLGVATTAETVDVSIRQRLRAILDAAEKPAAEPIR